MKNVTLWHSVLLGRIKHKFSREELYQTQWVLFHECEDGSVLENQSREFTI